MKQLMLAAAVQFANRSVSIDDVYWDKTVARVVQEGGLTYDVRGAIEAVNNVSIGAGRFGGQCPRFVSSGQRLTVGGTPFALNSDFTIEGHFFFEDIDASSNQYFMDFGNNGFILRYYGTGIAVYNGGGVIIQSGIKPQNDRWYHIAVVRHNQTLTLYIDGVAAGSAIFTTSLSYSTYTLGNYGGGGNYQTRGMIDQFRVVQEAVYTSDFVVPDAPFAIGGAEATYDPYWDDVVALLDASGDGTLVDAKGLQVVENVGAGIITSGTKIGAAAAQFSALGQYLRIQDTVNIFDFGTSPWTMEAWVKPTAINTGIGYLIGRGTASSFGGWSLVLNNMRPQLRWTTTGTSWNKITPLITDSALTLGIWYHIAAVRFGNSFLLFVNGKLISSVVGAADTIIASDIPVTFGNASDAAGQFYGVMDSIRITRGSSRYVSEFTPKMKSRYASNGNVVASANDPYWPKVPTLLDFTKDIGAGPDQFSIVLRRNGALIDSSALLFGKPTVRLESGASGGFNYSNGSKTLLGQVDFTAEGWIKTNFSDAATFLPIIGQWHASATGAWAIGVTNSKLRWLVRNGLDISGTSNIADGLWHHVAVSCVAGTLRLFVDGVMEASAAVGPYPIYNGNIQVGYNIVAEAASGFITHLGRVRLTQGKGRYTGNFATGKDTVQLTSLAA